MNSTARDTLYIILLNANLATISQYCQINRNAIQICNNNRFWQEKYLRDFGFTPSTANTNWYQLYQTRYQMNWALQPQRALIFIIQNRGQIVETPMVILGNDEVEALQRVVNVYNENLINDPLYDIINQLKSIVSPDDDETLPDKPATIQQFLTFFHELDLYPVDVYQTKSAQAFVIIKTYPPAKLIAVISGKDEIDIMQKIIDIYNNDVTASPLYSIVDSVLHLYANDPDFMEPSKPISLESFWEEAQTNGELMWQIYPVTIIPS